MRDDAASPMAFGELLGARVELDGPEEVVCRVRIEAAHLNQGLIAQGGVLFTLADLALGLLINREGEDATWVSTGFSLQLFRGAGVGDVIRAGAVPEHRSRSLRACRVTITRDDGALIGTMTNQAIRLPARDTGRPDTGRLTVRPAGGDGPLERALAAARRRLHGDAAASPADSQPVLVELDGAPVGTALLDPGAPGGVRDAWVPTHHRGTGVEAAVDAALARAAAPGRPAA